MSSSVDPEEVVTVSEGGVTVTKRYAPEEFPVPAIRFEIESDHDGPVTVQLTESIPESFPMDAVGFHPEYHSDQWTAFQDNRVQFTGTVNADSSLVTVYGIRLNDEFDSADFLSEPSISVEGADVTDESTASDVSASVEDVVSADDNEVVKEMLSGDRDSVPGLETDDSASDSDADTSSDDSEPEIELDIDAAAERVADETTDDDDPSGAPDSSGGTDDTADEMESGIPASASADSGSENPIDDGNGSSGTRWDSDIVSELATALRSERLDEGDVQTIRDALDSSTSGSTQAKLSHLQERVEEVAAYTGALEEFLDEEGTGAEVVAEVRAELEGLRSELASVAETAETNAVRLEELDSLVTEHSDTLESVTASVSTVENDLDDVSDQVSTLDESVEELDDRTGAIESDVEDNATELDSVSASVDEIEDDLESVSDDVSDILEWRSQLGSMFND